MQKLLIFILMTVRCLLIDFNTKIQCPKRINIFQHHLTSLMGSQILSLLLIRRNNNYMLNTIIDGYKYPLLIDTGSNQIVVKSQSISAPPVKRIDSTKYKNKKFLTKVYGCGEIKYFEVQVLLNLVKGDKIPSQSLNMKVLLMTEAFSLYCNQNLLGLAPFEKSKHFPQGKLSFLNILKENNIIKKLRFGLYLPIWESKHGVLDLGQPNISAYENYLYCHKFDPKDNHYNVEITYVNQKKYHENFGILDSGTSTLTFPYIYKQDILYHFNKHQKIKCWFDESYSDFSVMRCLTKQIEDFPTMEIQIDQKTYSIQKEYYISQCTYDQNQYTRQCNSFIELSKLKQLDKIILGLPFFKKYYIFFDLEHQQIGIAPYKLRNYQLMQETKNRIFTHININLFEQFSKRQTLDLGFN